MLKTSPTTVDATFETEIHGVDARVAALELGQQRAQLRQPALERAEPDRERERQRAQVEPAVVLGEQLNFRERRRPVRRDALELGRDRERAARVDLGRGAHGDEQQVAVDFARLERRDRAAVAVEDHEPGRRAQERRRLALRDPDPDPVRQPLVDGHCGEPRIRGHDPLHRRDREPEQVLAAERLERVLDPGRRDPAVALDLDAREREGRRGEEPDAERHRRADQRHRLDRHAGERGPGAPPPHAHAARRAPERQHLRLGGEQLARACGEVAHAAPPALERDAASATAAPSAATSSCASL
jgi:hypothetical protein